MSSKNALIIGLIIVTGIMIYFLNEDQKALKAGKKRIKELEEDRLRLIKDSLSNSVLSDEVKNQILKLISEYKNIDEDVSSELISVLSLIEIGQNEKAIKDLAKIIENILTEKFRKEEKFKKYKKFIPLANLIEYAKEIKLFNNKEYNASCILKEFRNEESHKLNVKYGNNWQMIGLLGGIEIIFKLKGELNPEISWYDLIEKNARKHNRTNEKRIRINTSNIPDGIYILKIVLKDGIITKQVVINK